MSMSSAFARVVAVVGGGAVMVRRMTQGSPAPAWGAAPCHSQRKAAGAPSPRSKCRRRKVGRTARLRSRRPASRSMRLPRKLDHPRWIQVLPNGDVLIAEATNAERPARSVFDYAMISTMKRANAVGGERQPDHPCCATGTAMAVAEIQQPFMEGLNQPFGMALLGDTFYVGNTRRDHGVPLRPRAPTGSRRRASA